MAFRRRMTTVSLNCCPEEMKRKLAVWGWHAKENRKAEEEKGLEMW